MASTFQVIALSSIDPEGMIRDDEPLLAFPDALMTAKSLKAQGKAFRVFAYGGYTESQRTSFQELGALI